MSRRAWWIIGTVGVLIGLFVWFGSRNGAFDSPEDLDRRAEGLEGSAPEDWPFGGERGSGPEPLRALEAGEAPDDGPSLELGGRASIALHDFTMNDKQSRRVLRIEHLTGTMDISALREGTYRVSETKVKGADIKLFRDPSGRISLTNALRDEPPTVRRALYMPPKEAPEGDVWLLEVGPIEVEDTFLTLNFTGKPVRFHIHHAKAMVRRGPEDDGPRIFLHDVQGEMVEPSPLPKPVRIAHASGVVQLEGSPMVDLTARTCIGGSELRAHAIVPAKSAPVQMTVDSSGVTGALGRMGLKIAARRKEDKLRYAHGPVKVDDGLDCDGNPVGEVETRQEKREERHEEKLEQREEQKARPEDETQPRPQNQENPGAQPEREGRREEKQQRREEKRENEEGDPQR